MPHSPKAPARPVSFRPACEELEHRLAPATLQTFNGLYQGFGKGTGTVLLTGQTGQVEQDVRVKVANGNVRVLAPAGNRQLQSAAVTLNPNGTARLKFKIKVTESGITATILVQGTARRLPDGDVSARGVLKSLTAGLKIANSSWYAERYKAVAAAAPSLTISDQSTVTHSIFVGDAAGVIRDLDVLLDIPHTFNSDLDVTLTHVPSGRSVELFSDVGGDDNGFNVLLSDEAPASVTGAADPDGLTVRGVFRPEGLLSAFNGVDASGEWRLTITDDASGDFGFLRSWSLFFSFK